MKRIFVTLCVVVALLCTPRTAYSEDPTPLVSGQAAPFTGVLLDAETAAAWAQLRVEVDLLRLQLAGRERLLQDATAALQESQRVWESRLATAVASGQPIDFWEKYDFTVGLVLGVVLTGLAVWAGIQVVESAG